MSLIIAGKYRASSKIGEGAFGKIFSGNNINTGDDVAVKIEEYTEHSMLENDAKIYSYLRDKYGIPSLKACGREGKYYYMVINLLGKSLDERRIENRGTLSLKTVISMGLQMLRRIETIHNCGIVHRDIKPENFLLGPENKSGTLYLIDFGLATPYVDGKQHVEMKNSNNLIGTARYTSINIHNGITPSRRDDIESIGYVLIYLLLGKLPWQGDFDLNSKERNNKICEIKKEYNLWSLCKEIPGEIIVFIEYARNIRDEEEPDYTYLKGLLVNLYKHKKFTVDKMYDWTQNNKSQMT